MNETRNRTVGCILIDEPTSGENCLSGLSFPPGVAPHAFHWQAGERPLPALQTLLQRVRREYGTACVLAWGAGCMAALALAEQLPVERLALVQPACEPVGTLFRPRRFTGFAMHNLALCVSDVLILEAGGGRVTRRIARGLRSSGWVALMPMPGKTGPDLYTNCENEVQRALLAFLLGEELPKNLAENCEMLYNH